MKSGIRRFLLFLFGLIVAVVTSIAVMMKGWGLEPRSWFWIIVVSFVGHIFAQIIITIARED